MRPICLVGADHPKTNERCLAYDARCREDLARAPILVIIDVSWRFLSEAIDTMTPCCKHAISRDGARSPPRTQALELLAP